jgi:hypothetical protein
LLMAWPDADAVAERLQAAVQHSATARESGESKPKELYQWFLAAGLLIMFRPWNWLRIQPTATASIALLLVCPSFAQDAASYTKARKDLQSGRWREARMRFGDSWPGGKDDSLVAWVIANSKVMEARETADRKARAELLASSIRLYRSLLKGREFALQQDDLHWNIAVAKSRLANAKSSGGSAETSSASKSKDDTKGGNERSHGTSSDSDKRIGTDVSGGGVERPVAGLASKDPGALSRTEAERIVKRVAQSTIDFGPPRKTNR